MRDIFLGKIDLYLYFHLIPSLSCTLGFFLPVSVNGRRLSNMRKWAALKSLGASYSLGPRASPTKARLAHLLCPQTSESAVAHKSTVRFSPHIRGLTDRESLKFLRWATNARTEHCCPWCWKQCDEGLKAQRCLFLTWMVLPIISTHWWELLVHILLPIRYKI